VAIAGTPTVAIAGTPTVAIAGGAPLSGAVEVTNLPAVQEISGTVAIEPRQPTWGSKSLSLGAAVLPAGLVLTDVSLTLLSPGAACTVRLNEKLAGVEAFRQLIWKLDEAHPVIEMHLQTGITSQTGTRQFEITLIDGTCLPLVLWSGYVP
jgi:hypothetical protein